MERLRAPAATLTLSMLSRSLACCLASLALLAPATLAQTACPSAPLLQSIGQGSPGTAGIPQLVPLGTPTLGAAFALAIEDAASSSAGALYFGAVEAALPLPTYGATAYLAPPLFSVAFGLDAQGNSPPLLAQSTLSPALCGAQLVFQAVVLDSSAQGGVAFTPGLRVGFGSANGPLFPGPSLPITGPGTNEPRALASADLNADGVLDLAVAHSKGISQLAEVWVLLGRGDGEFDVHAVYPIGRVATALRIADVDANAAPDLLVTCSATDDLWVLLGAGDGSFSTLSQAVGNMPPDLALVDSNLDGVPDLGVLQVETFARLRLYLGAGTGSFVSSANVPLPVQGTALTAADLDADGRGDLVASLSADQGVTVALALANGGFAPGQTLPAGTTSADVVSADLDGDGALDLAVANAFSDDVSVLYGLGDGSFAPTQSEPAGTRPDSLAAADLDGDGAAELVVGSTGGDSAAGSLRVLSGAADSALGLVQEIHSGESPRALQLDDFDGDGQLDLAVAHADSSDVGVFAGGAGTSFAAAQTYPAGPDPRDVRSADLDGDGAPDLVVASSEGVFSPGEVAVLLATGDGLFAPPQAYPAGQGPDAIAVGDLNADGVPDLAVANEDSQDLSLLAGLGDGSFAPAVTLAPGAGATAIELADLNGDGDRDVLLSDGLFQGSLLLLPSDGAGGFGSALSFAVGALPEDVALGDVDGDGELDLLCTNESPGNVAVLLGTGGGSFVPAQFSAAGPGAFGLAVGDLDADGALDLVSANLDGDDLSLLLGQGDGGFAAPQSLAIGGACSAVAIADLDADGSLDLAATEFAFGKGQLHVLRGSGDGGFEAPQAFASPIGPWALAVDDLDGDGARDLALAHPGSFFSAGRIAVLRNQLLQ